MDTDQLRKRKAELQSQKRKLEELVPKTTADVESKAYDMNAIDKEVGKVDLRLKELESQAIKESEDTAASDAQVRRYET